MLKGQTVSVSATIGLVVYPDHGRTLKELARHADLAMYQARENGCSQLHVYQIGPRADLVR